MPVLPPVIRATSNVVKIVGIIQGLPISWEVSSVTILAFCLLSAQELCAFYVPSQSLDDK